MDTSETNSSSTEKEQASLKWYLYQVTGPSNEVLVHAVYPSVEKKHTYVLYHPDRKSRTLHLLHHLKDTIETIFSPKAVKQYFSTDEITVLGHPRINATTKPYVRTLIDLTEGNP